jgi:hypothetical protein
MNRYIKSITLKNNNLSQEQINSYVKSLERLHRSKHANLVITDEEISFALYSKLPYEKLVNQLVREKYTDSEEFAILRKAINGITDEFLIYNAFVEECKTKAKQFIAERERVINE